MLEPGSIQAGDEAVVVDDYGRMTIVKVAKVTPGGQIVLPDDRRYRSDGSRIGGDKWHSSRLRILTPELREEIHRIATRRRNLSILNDIQWGNVDDKKLEQITAILKDE